MEFQAEATSESLLKGLVCVDLQYVAKFFCLGDFQRLLLSRQDFKVLWRVLTMYLATQYSELGE